MSPRLNESVDPLSVVVHFFRLRGEGPADTRMIGALEMRIAAPLITPDSRRGGRSGIKSTVAIRLDAENHKASANKTLFYLMKAFNA